MSGKFTDECHYTSEFKGGTPARRDLHRILVAFDEEADQVAFRGLLRIPFRDQNGVWLHAQISQDRVSYQDILGSEKGKEKVYIVLKKMPDSFTMSQIEAAFTTFTWGKRGFEHPFLASFDKVT